MKIEKKKKYGRRNFYLYNIILCCFLSLFIQCENRSLFTELADNRLEIRFKGTFESNGPVRGWAWSSIDPNQAGAGIQDDSVDDYSNGIDERPTTIMFDIAEIRLDRDLFSNYRQILSITLNDSHDFFNGNGVVLRNDDPFHDQNYLNVRIYFRKMLFDKAKRYRLGSNGWEYVEDNTDMFHEKDVKAFNFNQFQVNSYYDSLRIERNKINRVFPLWIPIAGGFKYNKNEEKTVLEIRIVVKNFIKKYEYNYAYDYFDDQSYHILHYYAFSDWLRDVHAGENYLGGNILAVARAYIPGKVGRITGTNSSGNNGYVIAIPSEDSITDYTVPASLTRGEGCDLPVEPSYTDSYIEPLLDYYLKLEKYRYDKTTALAGCSDFETYSQKWTNYENEIRDFKIPPLVVWSTNGSAYEITNVSPGTYNVYFVPVTSSPFYGRLFKDDELNDTDKLTVVPVTVSIDSDTVVDIP